MASYPSPRPTSAGSRKSSFRYNAFSYVSHVLDSGAGAGPSQIGTLSAPQPGWGNRCPRTFTAGKNLRNWRKFLLKCADSPFSVTSYPFVILLWGEKCRRQFRNSW
jgi:hypothetical protein